MSSKRKYQCPHCKINCYADRSLTNHISKCNIPKSNRPFHLTEYTNATFNREIRAGNVNPHFFPTGAQYRHQLHYQPSVIDQSKSGDITESQDYEVDQAPDSINTLDLSLAEHNDDDSNSCSFSVGEDAVDHDDCNINLNEYEVEEDLPMLYKDVSMRYRLLKKKRPPQSSSAPRIHFNTTTPCLLL